jgi:DNA-binding Lrp family transcriptional regulator
MTWTFLTNHGLVLLAISRRPDQPMRQMAASVGITERTCHAIVKELEEQGYLTRTRAGRSNVYVIASDRPMRHGLTKDHAIGELLKLLG